MAIAERYASVAGAGTHDGTSAANAFTFAEMVTDINAGSKAGNRYNVIQGAGYSFAADAAITGSGSATSPVIIRGYASTIGDGYLGRTNGNGALITTNMPVLTFDSTFRLNITGSWIITEALNVAGTRDGALFLTTADTLVRSCKSTNASTGSSAVALSLAARCRGIDCDITLSGASGGQAALNLPNAASAAFGCRVRGGPAVGALLQAGTTLYGCVVYRCAGTAAVYMSVTGQSPQIIGNTIVSNTTDGIRIITGTTVIQAIFGNLITDNTGYGINGISAANAILAAYNRLDRNTAGATNLATDWLAATSYGHNTTSVTQAQEYQDAATDDYRLLSTSPALGVGLFPYLDIGAIQRVVAAAGGISRARAV